MKNKILLTVCLLISFAYSYSRTDTKDAVSEEKTVNVFYTSDIQEIARTFVHEYSKSNGNLNFKLNQVSSDQILDKVRDENSLGFISESAINSESKDLQKMLIARHIIVPVTNVENPNLKRLEENGISIKELQSSAVNADSKPFNIYVLEDEYTQNCLSKFLDVKESSLPIIKMSTKAEMIQQLKRDKSAIGFCCLRNLTIQDQNNMAANFKILPIDRNENGHADYHEIVYRPLNVSGKNSGNLSEHETAFGSLDAFERGVWIGKFPHALVNDLYLVANEISEDSEISDFIAWAITDGQQFIDGTDYTQLVYSERQSKLNDLHPNDIIVGTTLHEKTTSRSILYIIAVLLVIAIITGFVVNYNKRKAKGLLSAYPGSAKVLNEKNVEIPNGIYFDKTHTWSFMEKDGSVKVGIDDFMQQVTGEFTNLKMKAPGEPISKNEPLVTLIQDGKQIDIYAPISGKILEINEDLVTEPSEINKSPYSKGWIYSIEPSNWQREISFMKMADSYKSWIKKEIERLKDFLAVALNTENNQQIAFQDGGEINNQVLKELGPRIWEDFQKDFIDTSDLN